MMNKSSNILAAFLVLVLTVITATWSQSTLAESKAGDIESPVVLLERTSTQVIKILRDYH